MLVNGIKIIFGFMLILGSLKEYANYYSQVERHSASAAAMILILLIVGIIFIVSGIKNKKFLSFFNKKSVLVSIGLIIITILIDYGYSSISRSEMKELKFIDHNFSIQFPSSPKITNFKPNSEAGFIGGRHLLSQVGSQAFMVVYYDYNKSILNNKSKKVFIENMLEAMSTTLDFTAANVVKTELQGFLAYSFYVSHDGMHHGKGLTCLAKNRLYFVLYMDKNKKPITDENRIDDYIKSFKILKM